MNYGKKMKINIKDYIIYYLLIMVIVMAFLWSDNIDDCVNFYENEINISELSQLRMARNHASDDIKYSGDIKYNPDYGGNLGINQQPIKENQDSD